MTPKAKPIAYPELIRAGDWRVHEWTGKDPAVPAPCVAGTEMYLPAGDSPFARDIRFHELLHAKYSPEQVPDIEGITQKSLLAAEDCRVNLKGAEIRPHDALGHGPAFDAFDLATTNSERDIARLTAASCGFASSSKVLAKLIDDLCELEENDSVPDWLNDHAANLRRAVNNVKHAAPNYINVDYMNFYQAIELARWLDTFSDDSVETVKAKSKGSEEEDGDYNDAPGEGGNPENAEWGRMAIETPPLVRSHKTSMGKRTTPSLFGTHVQNWNRLATGEIFGRTRKRAVPDAVLIDQSGSMHWDDSKLEELVSRMPVGIIAGYSGESGQGVLRILAKDGRMVAEEQVVTPYGGNEVDGPALRWLAKQRGRKVWVSDEGVCSDLCSDDEALMADCRQVIGSAGIRVTCSTEPRDIMRALQGIGGKRG